MNFIIFYVTLIISLVLSKFSVIFQYISFLILISPLIFYDLEKFGFYRLKGIILGLAVSIVYIPFLNINLIPVNQIPQILAEEIFFRGYVQNEINKKYNTHISIIIASLLFALGHFILFFSFLSAATFLPSIIFGYLYFYSRSIWASFIFHFFSNWFFLSNSSFIVKFVSLFQI